MPARAPKKRAGAWMDDCVGRKDFGAEHTMPVAYLVCNFLPAGAGKPALLTHDDVVTMFHEFGHGLHHMLTRVGYPSIAGINGVSWDAVELPSQFLENFAWRPEVLATMARHFETGAPLPADKQAQLLGSRTFHAGLATMRQLEFALFDFRLHAEYDPARGARIGEILAEVRNEVAVFAVPEWNRFPHNFGHIFAGGYAAGYYSYKWAEVLAADAFAAFEEHGVFDRKAAQRFLDAILSAGRQPQGARRVRRISRPGARRERAAAPAGPRRGELGHCGGGPTQRFSIATWNVNSLRVRGEQLMQWLRAHPPDVVALQETKMQDPDFPHPEFTAAGYHSVFSGQKTYNGVALLSRHADDGFRARHPRFRRSAAPRARGDHRSAIPRDQPVRAERPGAGLRKIRLQAALAGSAHALAEDTKPRSIPASWCWAISTSLPRIATCTTRRRGSAACT